MNDGSCYEVLIIEDSQDEAAALQSLLGHYGESNGVTLNVTTYDRADDFISSGRDFDLIFMDIDLPGIDGMEAAHLLRSYDEVTPLIFVTNLSQYALKGYEVNALDFLVKPVTYYDLSLRMRRALRIADLNRHDTITLRLRGELRVIPLSELSYIELSGHNLVYHLISGEEISTRQTIASVEEELSAGPFLRISSGCLVNMNRITGMRGSTLTMRDGTMLPVSRSRKKTVMIDLARYLGSVQT